MNIKERNKQLLKEFKLRHISQFIREMADTLQGEVDFAQTAIAAFKEMVQESILYIFHEEVKIYEEITIIEPGVKEVKINFNVLGEDLGQVTYQVQRVEDEKEREKIKSEKIKSEKIKSILEKINNDPNLDSEQKEMFNNLNDFLHKIFKD